MKISVLIPNFNSANILKKNFPQVAEVIEKYILDTKQNAEIFIIDDGSRDNSREIIEDLISKYSNDNLSIKSIYNNKNYGFSTTINNGAKQATGEILVLLNTDVIPKKDFLVSLIKHFKDEDIFAVGCMDESVENEKIVLRGRGVGSWKRGLLIHWAGELNKQNTLWVSGGSGAFRKKIWDKLGGLNEIYNPFYWEDIDLSYRALKSGFKVIFEKQSIVRHEHETGTIKRKFSPFDIKTIAYRNQFVFVWENGDFKNILKNIFYLPYLKIKALINLDWAFFLGLLKALIILPKVIQSSSKNRKLFIKSDDEVICSIE